MKYKIILLVFALFAISVFGQNTTRIIPGPGISVSPSSGVGNVTVSATGGGGGGEMSTNTINQITSGAFGISGTIWTNFGNVVIAGTLNVTNSIDSSGRFLKDPTGHNTVDYGGLALNDTTGAPMIEWGPGQRYIRRTAGGNIVIDWGNMSLQDSSALASVVWGSRTLNSTGGSVVNWGSGLLTNPGGGVTLVDWLSQYLGSSSGQNLNWGAHRLENTWTNRGDLVVVTNATVGQILNVGSNGVFNVSNLVVNAALNKVNVNRAAGTGHSGFAFDVLGSAIVEGSLKLTNATAQISSPLGSLTLAPSNGNSYVVMSGGIRFNRTQVSVNYTNLISDYLIGWRYSVAAPTNFLPDPASVGPLFYRIKDELKSAASTNIVIFSLGGAKIDLNNSTNITANGGSIGLYNDGVNWFTSP